MKVGAPGSKNAHRLRLTAAVGSLGGGTIRGLGRLKVQPCLTQSSPATPTLMYRLGCEHLNSSPRLHLERATDEATADAIPTQMVRCIPSGFRGGTDIVRNGAPATHGAQVTGAERARLGSRASRRYVCSDHGSSRAPISPQRCARPASTAGFVAPLCSLSVALCRHWEALGSALVCPRDQPR
jgi:hypothetical protein